MWRQQFNVSDGRFAASWTRFSFFFCGCAVACFHQDRGLDRTCVPCKRLRHLSGVGMDIQSERERLLDAEGGGDGVTGLLSERDAYLR